MSLIKLAKVGLTLPQNTDYVALFVHARENIFDDNGYGEFDGHYVDAVTFEVVLIPSAVILGSLGITFSGWMLKRKRMV